MLKAELGGDDRDSTTIEGIEAMGDSRVAYPHTILAPPIAAILTESPIDCIDRRHSPNIDYNT